MKKILVILLLLLSVKIFSQSSEIIYDTSNKDYYIESKEFIEKILSEDWASWAEPRQNTTIKPIPLQTKTISDDNEFYNIGVLFYNQAVIAFNRADKTENQTDFLKWKDIYLFYWDVSSIFFEKSYQVKPSRETLICLKHIYARLNQVENFNKVLNRLKNN